MTFLGTRFFVFFRGRKNHLYSFQTHVPWKGMLKSIKFQSGNARTIFLQENLIFVQEILDFQKSWFC
jgi:hypothetical protein